MTKPTAKFVAHEPTEQIMDRLIGKKWEVKTIPLGKLTVNTNIQTRWEQIDKDHLEMVEEGMLHGASFPRMIVVPAKRRGDYWVVDGHHRRASLEAVGADDNEPVDAYVLPAGLEPEEYIGVALAVNNHQGWPQLLTERRHQALALHRKGYSATAIAARVTAKTSTVNNWVQEEVGRERLQALKIDADAITRATVLQAIGRLTKVVCVTPELVNMAADRTVKAPEFAALCSGLNKAETEADAMRLLGEAYENWEARPDSTTTVRPKRPKKPPWEASARPVRWILDYTVQELADVPPGVMGTPQGDELVESYRALRRKAEAVLRKLGYDE